MSDTKPFDIAVIGGGVVGTATAMALLNRFKVSLVLLEKEDKPNPNSTQPFVAINAAQNCYKAWGSYLKEPLYQWTKETNAAQMSILSATGSISLP